MSKEDQGVVITRKQSKAGEESTSLITQLRAKRKHYENQIKRLKKGILDNASLNAYTKGEVNERFKKIEDSSNHLEEIYMELVCNEEVTDQDASQNNDINDLVMTLKAKLADKLDAFNKIDNAQPNQAQQPTEPLQIEVQHMDATGNIPNVWGNFNGDYAKWKSFRDRWLASMHNNTKVPVITKFQNLKKACIGQAGGALGEWDLTEENYQEAWERLKSIYEDDYMQVQSFMQMLEDLPPMCASSSETIRNTIDLMQKHIHGLKGYVQIDDKHPYVVFAVIRKMDTDTYRSWEKYRPTLAKQAQMQARNVQQEGAVNENNNNAFKPGKYIPNWTELEQFLESEVTIRVHDENRKKANNQALSSKTNKQHDNPMSKGKQKRFGKQINANKKHVADFLQCVLCDGTHPIFKCQVFIDMNVNARLNHVTQYNLCVRCLRKNHNGKCERKQSNDPCPKCEPETKYHNSTLCPKADQSVHATFKANDQRKRKNYSNGKHDNYAKRKRYDNNNKSKSDNMPSGVNKIGEWSLVAKESNAIKRIKSPNTSKFEFAVLLATVNMRMHINNIDTVDCRGIADMGATLNCITANFVLQNEFTTIKCQKRILGVTGPEMIKRKIRTIIRPWFQSGFAISTEFCIINRLDGFYPNEEVESSKEEIMHLGLADENFDVPAPIDALLGAEIYAEIIGTDLYKHKSGAIMQSTELGHIILGKFVVKQEPTDLPILSIVQENKNDDMRLQKALTRFWEIEEVNKCENKAVLNEEQKLVEELFLETYYREQNGRYVVTVPIKPSGNALGDSRNLALKQFMQLERRFQRNLDLKRKYVEYMNENLKNGYMKKASKPNSNELCYYLPHHAVLKKFRVVLNASAKTTNGESLNSIQMKGAKLQFDIQLQAMRFRRHRYAVTTDITKMFNRIGLNPKQWDLHRILWRASENDPLEEYVMTVVIFGEKSSSYNSVRAMNQCALDYQSEYPKASQVIQKSFYMDDGIFGCETIHELKILCKEVEFVLGLGNFLLKGWASNSKEVEKHMDAHVRGEIAIGKDDETKILGLRWIKSTDELTIAVKEISKQTQTTKRKILGETARLYDPNGFIAPIIIKAKMLMQDIWKQKELQWDDEVPQNIKNNWAEFYADLPRLSEFRIKRWIRTSEKSKIQIHAFCDASEKAYGTTIYVRIRNGMQTFSSALLSAKSRVAPLKEMTIPRLELLAAVMLSVQLEAVIEACEFENADVTLWSDSMVVLGWIKKQPHELKAFVANRVEAIQQKTKKYKWKHVRSADNPADLVSRGMHMRDFLKSKLWLEGPNWLTQEESKWPISKLIISPEINNEIVKECKPKMNVMQVFNICSGNDNELIYDKFQDFDTILNVTAYVLRIRDKARRKSIPATKYITGSERNKAIEFWVKFEQNKAFTKEIGSLKAGDRLPYKSEIASLRPILDANGILRVGGRIDKASIMYAKRHQYIIPQKSRLSLLLLAYAHGETLHGGAQVMMQFLRRRFWIPKLRLEARAYTKACVKCVRQAQEMSQQIMAELPEIRVKPAPPFQHVGVDMAGPYNMRITEKISANTRGRNLPNMKGWIAVFVCLITRAVHLEVVEGLSSDDFLVAYTKFTGRRGNPEKIYSDHGTNFVGTDHDLQRALQTWSDDEIQRYVHLNGTEWHFITPSAPHEGGIWEAAVKQMKHHLKRVIGVQKYSFQGMSALLVGVEACLNSRPLCKMSDDPEDQEVLTPAHFLIGRSLKLPMYEKASTPPYNIKRLYLQLQFQIQAFWKQWSNDYLQSLMQLPKWREEQENIKIGQLVIIKADNIPPAYWAMGKVMQAHHGTDGKIRSVTLKTQTGILERSIRKICVLPTDVDISYWKQ